MQHERGRVVVGVDGSWGSRDALAYALAEAARRGVTAEVVTVVAPQEYWVPFYGRPTVPIDEIREKVRRGTEQMVHEAVADLGSELGQPPPVTVQVESGSPAHTLLRSAEGAELLVVGSRGRGELGSRLLGSVGLACALHGTCPVTVVHGEVRAGEPQVREAAVPEGAPALG